MLLRLLIILTSGRKELYIGTMTVDTAILRYAAHVCAVRAVVSKLP